MPNIGRVNRALTEELRFDWTGGCYSQPGWQADPGATWHAGRAHAHGPVQTHAQQQSRIVQGVNLRHKSTV